MYIMHYDEASRQIDKIHIISVFFEFSDLCCLYSHGYNSNFENFQFLDLILVIISNFLYKKLNITRTLKFQKRILFLTIF